MSSIPRPDKGPVSLDAGGAVRAYRTAKALCDGLAALAAVVVALPVMAVVAALIKATSAGPVLFKQERVGLAGRPFTIYKFRTMFRDAHRAGTSVTTATDRRITAVGRLLRRTKLDELPQLLNVLTGDMSLVGPRPDVLEIVAKYTPEMRRIFDIRPGITSLATLHLRDEEAVLTRAPDPDRFYDEVMVPLKVRLALEHVDRHSLWFDLGILTQTVWMLTPLGRAWPVREHPLVAGMRRALERGEENGHGTP